MSEIGKLREKYKNVLEKKEVMINELRELETNELIRRYFALKQTEMSLYSEELELKKKIKFYEYRNCNHLLVVSEVQHDYDHDKKYSYCGCIKCGLDEAVTNLDLDEMSYDEKIQYEFLKNKNSFSSLIGTYTDESCDMGLATAIYKRILEHYPNIDDNKLIKYFGATLKGIRSHKVCSLRRDSRVKRLNLKKGFNNWSEEGIHKCCK